MSPFFRCSPQEIVESPVELIGKQWMLITAGDKQACNTMTAAWGGLGVLWNVPAVFVYVRPQRYTYTFLEQQDTFSVSFLSEEHREALRYCGAHSGREGDKFAATGLSVFYEDDTPCIAQARLVLVCRKRHVVDLAPQQFTDPAFLSYYKANDFHRQYIGEILTVLRK